MRTHFVVQQGLRTPTIPSFGSCCIRGIHGPACRNPHHPFNPPGKYWDMYKPEQFPVPEAFRRQSIARVPFIWSDPQAAAPQSYVRHLHSR